MRWQITPAASWVKNSRFTSTRFCSLLLCFCSVVFDVRAGDGEFYARFRSSIHTNRIAPWMPVTDSALVDHGNTNARLAGITVKLDELMTHGQLGQLQLGMDMDTVIEKWGRPRILYGRCYGGHRFVYSDCNLVFRSNTLFKIMLDRNTAFDRGASTRWNLQNWTNLLGGASYMITNRSGIQLVYETRGDRHTAFLLKFDDDGNASLPPTLYYEPVITNSQPYFP